MTTTPRLWPGLLAGALHLAVLPFYAASGLLAPPWAILALGVVWVALAGTIVVLHRSSPVVALLAPVAALAIWFGAITAGEQLLGWTG